MSIPACPPPILGYMRFSARPLALTAVLVAAATGFSGTATSAAPPAAAPAGSTHTSVAAPFVASGITVSPRSISQDTLKNPIVSGTAPVGSRITLQVLVKGRWAASLRFNTPKSGSYRVALRYGNGAVGTYQYRLVTGRIVSPTVTVRRTAELSATSRATTRADVSKTWRPGCPVHHNQLRTVDLNHWGFDGLMHRGQIVVHKDVAASALEAFAVGIDTRFPIAGMREVSAYDGNDDRSMAANNSSGFNCRRITNGTSWSKHSYGRAIDINPVQNPYVYRGKPSPPAGKAYMDRSKIRPGMMVASSPFTKAFTERGWRWLSTYDYQHVER